MPVPIWCRRHRPDRCRTLIERQAHRPRLARSALRRIALEGSKLLIQLPAWRALDPRMLLPPPLRPGLRLAAEGLRLAAESRPRSPPERHLRLVASAKTRCHDQLSVLGQRRKPAALQEEHLPSASETKRRTGASGQRRTVHLQVVEELASRRRATKMASEAPLASRQVAKWP